MVYCLLAAICGGALTVPMLAVAAEQAEHKTVYGWIENAQIEPWGAECDVVIITPSRATTVTADHISNCRSQTP